jgi:UDP-2,3-diacylglucosamine pyrophosphatase LpxH
MLHFAIDHDYSICINGDGVDFMQLSLQAMTGDLTPSLALFARVVRRGRRIYYTVGNHDIQLEHFLSDIGPMNVAPFLNLRSGEKRIRIEHGHTYDEMFLKYPRLYWLFTMIGRWSIIIHPRFYKFVHDLNHDIIAGVEYLQSGFKPRSERMKSVTGEFIEGERQCFREGAEMAGIRGFDAVVFGHTHLEGSIGLSSGVRYYNTGSWFGAPYCVAIDQGEIWFGPVSDLTTKGDPFPRKRPEQAAALG